MQHETTSPIDWFGPDFGGRVHVDPHGSFVGAEAPEVLA